MAVNVQWLTEQDIIPNIHWIAGKKGSKKIISSVNLLDNPDTVRWMKGEEFILTTGYFFLKNPEKIVEELHRRNCAGIGIKLKRYFDEVPKEMLEKANELGFPILEMPYDRSFAEINSAIYKGIYDSELSETEKLASIYRKLTNLVIINNDIEELLSCIMGIIGYPLFITNRKFNMISYECPENMSEAFEKAVILNEKQTVFQNNIASEIIDEYEERKFEVKNQLLEYEGEEVNCVIVPIVDKDNLIGFFNILEIEKKLSTFEYNFITGIKSILALVLLRYNMENKGKKNIKGDFFKSVLLGNLSNKDEITTQCELAGFDYLKKRVCSVINIERFIGLPAYARKKIEEDINGSIYNVSLESGITYYSVHNNNSMIIFFMFNDYVMDRDCIEESFEISKGIEKKLKEYEINAKIGLSLCSKGIFTIKKSFMQATKAIKVGYRIHAEESVYSYNSDYVFHLILDAIKPEMIRQTYNDTISILDKYDVENNSELVKTLKGYLDNQYNLTKAAGALYIHRNTMSIRMEKIKELLDYDDINSEQSFKLQLGIYIKYLIDGDLIQEV